MTIDEHHGSRRLLSRPSWFRWSVAFLVLVVLSSSTVAVSPQSVAASGITAERVTAVVLYRQTQSIYGRVNVLGEKYDLAQIELNKINDKITYTKNVVSGIEQHVAKDDAQLRADAIFAYVTNGSAESSSPLFSSNVAKSEARNIYNQVAEGDIGTTLSRLKGYKIFLVQERSILSVDRRRAAAEETTAKRAFLVAQGLERYLQSELARAAV